MPVPNTDDDTLKIARPSGFYPAEALTMPSLARVRPPATEQSAIARPPLEPPAPIAAPVPPRLLLDARWYHRVYHLVDRVSGGHAAPLEQLFAFLVAGGSGALINLAGIQAFDVYNTAHPHAQVPYLALTAIATEISLLFNFLLNDRFTFRHQIDHSRTFLQRCVRFHGPASVGFFLTLILSYTFHLILSHVRPIVPQAMAIVIVMFVNFLMHKFWTYRAKKPAPAVAH